MTATAATATSVSTTGPAPGAIRPLAWFALLSYGWTWGVGLLVALLLRSGGISEFAADLVFMAAGFGPVLAALIIAASLGRATLRGLLPSLVRWRVAPAWCGGAL